MISPAWALCEIPPLVESRRSSLVVALESMAILSSHVVHLSGRIFLGYALPGLFAPPQVWHPPISMIEEWEGLTPCSYWGSLLRVSVRASIFWANSLFWANVTSWAVNSRRLLFVGMYARSRRMVWSLATIFSINSIASYGVFILIFPPADVSKSCFDYGCRPSMKMFSCTSLLYPCVGVFLSSPWKWLSTSLTDSSGNWWNEDISIFPSAVFDSGKYFFQELFDNFLLSPQVISFKGV